MKVRKLFEDIKNYLNITWNDRETDKRLEGIIARGKEKVMTLTNSYRSDFDRDSSARSLLFEYCRLAWAGVPEKFDELYSSELIGTRLDSILEEWNGRV